MAYQIKLNNYERNLQEALDLVGQYYGRRHMGRMTEIEIQYEFGRLHAAGHKFDTSFTKFSGLTCEDLSYDTRYMLNNTECHVVYHFYGEGDKLLYVGRTNSFNSRWSQHLASDKEMHKVVKVEFHLFETKSETMFYETQKIAILAPPWNIAGIGVKPSKQHIAPVGIVVMHRTDKTRSKVPEHYWDKDLCY